MNWRSLGSDFEQIVNRAGSHNLADCGKNVGVDAKRGHRN
jgi:hypothetical protein